MQDIVQEAMQRDEAERKAKAESTDDDTFGDPRIVIVGCTTSASTVPRRSPSTPTSST
jgi:hypothetical protein